MIKMIHQQIYKNSRLRIYKDREHRFKITITNGNSFVIELHKWESSGWAYLFGITYGEAPNEEDAIRDCEGLANRFVSEENEKVG